MKSWLLVETRDPSMCRDVDFTAALAAGLARKGEPATLFLAGNGVFAARAGSRDGDLRALLRGGVRVLADRSALRERGLEEADLIRGAETAELDVVLDALASGAQVIWR